MKREIKFRTIADGELLYSDECENLSEYFEHTHLPVYLQMQSTGMKDKNGKEIYEGDCILCKYESIDPTEVETYIGSVRFQHAAFLFCGKGEDEFHPLGDLKTEEMEIIGNIHFNPELINA